jgi:hypothetical protein
MNEAVLKEKLLELADTVTAAPLSGNAEAPKDGVYLPHRVGPQPSMDDAIEHLKLQVTYMLFDLEATRRENRYLRQMLEGRSRQDRDSTSDRSAPACRAPHNRSTFPRAGPSMASPCCISRRGSLAQAALRAASITDPWSGCGVRLMHRHRMWWSEHRAGPGRAGPEPDGINFFCESRLDVRTVLA